MRPIPKLIPKPPKQIMPLAPQPTIAHPAVAQRQALLSSYLQERSQPDSLLSLAAQVQPQQITQAVPTAVKAANRAVPAARTEGQRAVQIAQSKVGIRESGHNAGGAVQFQKAFGGSAGQAWCGYFVGSIAKQAGARGLTQRVASVPAIIQDAQAHRNGLVGWYHDPRIAHPGDFVVLHGGGHVEMVVSVNRDGSVNTVGGNTSIPGGEGVGRKRRGRGEITGFARVNYR